jgi:hypothetical protein
MYEAPNWTVPKQNDLNQAMQNQTKACINKSCEVCTLLRYYVAMSGNFTPTFCESLSVPASRIKKSKTENRVQGKLNDTLYPPPNF